MSVTDPPEAPETKPEFRLAVGLDDVTVWHGDCLTVLQALPDTSIDAVVTDPPYGLEFMGKDWDRHDSPLDFQQWCQLWAAECLRVLKPGGHLLAFGGTRTYHRLVCAIEDVGFEVRDCLTWLYGQGFPKSLDVSKAIAIKAAGAEREVIGKRALSGYGKANVVNGQQQRFTTEFPQTSEVPATPSAEKWAGWGTALKPASEPIVVARKPIRGTVAASVLEHGTGALNIGGCRVAHASDADRAESEAKNAHATFGSGPRENRVFGADLKDRGEGGDYDATTGRWPTNVLLTHSPDCQRVGSKTVRIDGHHPAARPGGGISTTGHAGQDELVESYTDGEVVEAWECVEGCPVLELDRQTGALRPGTAGPQSGGITGGLYRDEPKVSTGAKAAGSTWAEQGGTGMHRAGSENTGVRDFGDVGGASRFFPTFAWATDEAPFRYVAKANSSERPTVTLPTGEDEQRLLGSNLNGKSKRCRVCGGKTVKPPDPDPACGHGDYEFVQAAPRLAVVAHPTVKPLALMQWLVRLVTAPGQLVLDPFAGSGTTLEAALLEGRRAVGIEREGDYLDLIRQRLGKPLQQGLF